MPQRIICILESLFKRCLLGHWLRYEELPNHIECFRRGGLKAGRKLVAVQVCAKGSEVDYYSGSHEHELETSRSLRSLHKISSSELARVHCVADRREFKEGALYVVNMQQ